MKIVEFGAIIRQMSTEMQEKRIPEREGVLFLIHKDGKVLLEERLRPDKAYYGYTIIPGGKANREIKEDHVSAAKREIEEECGISVKDLVLLDTFRNVTISNTLYNVSAYFIDGFEGEVRNVEGKSRHVWVDIKEASKEVCFADQKYVILLAQLYLSGIKL